MRMTDLKERRQRAIADLIRAHTLSSQEELADRLGSLGYSVTQVLDEVARLADVGAQAISFEDDSLFVHRKRFLELADDRPAKVDVQVSGDLLC